MFGYAALWAMTLYWSTVYTMQGAALAAIVAQRIAAEKND
jgi:hypothetical protein